MQSPFPLLRRIILWISYDCLQVCGLFATWRRSLPHRARAAPRTVAVPSSNSGIGMGWPGTRTAEPARNRERKGAGWHGIRTSHTAHQAFLSQRPAHSPAVSGDFNAAGRLDLNDGAGVVAGIVPLNRVRARSIPVLTTSDWNCSLVMLSMMSGGGQVHGHLERLQEALGRSQPLPGDVEGRAVID